MVGCLPFVLFSLRLEVGKLADLVVVSEDPLSVPPDRLLDLRADMTVIDGKIAFRR